VWQKTLFITFLFYIFALLQSSFFTHFNLFGVVPNLVFALFFSISFFEKNDNYFQVIVYAAIAGFFLDIFSFPYVGPSFAFLIIIGILLKKIQSLLKEKENNYPFAYFLPLFVIFLLIYNLSISFYLYIPDFAKIVSLFNWKIIFLLCYNSIFAALFFYIHEKIFGK